MKILSAVDGSPCSDVAVEEVARRPWPEGSSIKVLTAYELPVPPTPEGWALPLDYFKDLDVALQKQARNTVDRALQTLKSKLDKSVLLDAALLPGPPRTLILEEAETWGADLICSARTVTVRGNDYSWVQSRKQWFRMQSVR